MRNGFSRRDLLKGGSALALGLSSTTKVLSAAPAATAAPPPPPTPNPTAVNLYENVRRLKLDVERIAALHGPRLATMDDLARSIGRQE